MKFSNNQNPDSSSIPRHKFYSREISMAEPKGDPKGPSSSAEQDVKAEPNVMEKELEAMTHSGKSPHHHQETHGRSDDIDKDTPIDEVKGPGVFGRIKEEIGALVGAIPSKKDKSDQSSS